MAQHRTRRWYRRQRTLILALALTLAVAGGAGAEDDSGDESPQYTPPPPPEALTQGEEIEPEVSIVEGQWATIFEYSVRGRVYAVRIQPAVGPAYYLYDSDGDGRLESRLGPLEGVPSTHQWRILTW